MSKVIRRAFLGLGTFLLAACATQYAPDQSFQGGYSEIQVSPEIYRVRFEIPWWRFFGGTIDFFSREHDLALLRSAELTLEKGCQYFLILGDEDSHVVSTKEGSEHASPAYIIRMLREKPSAPEIVAYDAAFVRQALIREYALETVGPLPNRAAGNCGG